MVHTIRNSIDVFLKTQSTSVGAVLAQVTIFIPIVVFLIPWNRLLSIFEIGTDLSSAKFIAPFLMSFFVTYPFVKICTTDNIEKVDIFEVFFFDFYELIIFVIATLLFSVAFIGLFFSDENSEVGTPLILRILIIWYVFNYLHAVVFVALDCESRSWQKTISDLSKNWWKLALYEIPNSLWTALLFLICLVPFGLGVIFSIPICVFSNFFTWRLVSGHPE